MSEILERRETVKRIRGVGGLLWCRCKRGSSGTVRDGVRDPNCIAGDREVLYDGPAGSSKTFSDCLYSYWLTQNFPNVRVLWLRETLKSIRESILEVFEDHILGPNHPMLEKGGGREHRISYTDPKTGGHIFMGGLDRPDLYLGSQWDHVVFFEAQNPRVRERHWTKVGTRNRGIAVPHPHCDYPDGVMPDGRSVREVLTTTDRFEERDAVRWDGRVHHVEAGCDDNGCPLFLRRMVAECNPDDMLGEESWLWKRYESGHMVRLQATHKDNPIADAQYLDTLRALPEPYRSVYYEGKWVSAQGKCWPTYDPDRHLVALQYRFDIGSGLKTVVVADWLDENGQPQQFAIASVIAGFDWGLDHPGSLQVLAVTGDKRAFRIAEVYRHQPDRGDDVGSIEWWAGQVVELTERFGIDVIRCDPSARAIWELFNQRMGKSGGRDLGGVCQPADNTRSTKDGVQGGIDLVRTMFAQDKLILGYDVHHGPRDQDLIRKRLPAGLEDEIPGYVLARDKTNPEKVLPLPDPDCVDHACFVAGTMIEGKRIEDVRVGDRVRTHVGWSIVTGAALTDDAAEVFELEFVGGTLRGTGDHPIWTQDGWKRLDSLTPFDTLCSWKRSSTAAGRGGSVLESGTSSAARGTCIEPCGSTRTVPFQSGCTSTTATETQRITCSKTWSYSLPPSTRASTGPQSAPLGTQGGSTECGIYPQRGTDRMKAERGTGITLDALRRWRSRNEPRVLSAVERTIPNCLDGSVRAHVSPHGVARAESTTSVVRASCVGRRSASTATSSSRLAGVPVLGVRRVGRSAVYNLTVDGAHTYFANGVLVSNCDAIRYACMDVFGFERRVKPQFVLSKQNRSPWMVLSGEEELEAMRRAALRTPSNDDRQLFGPRRLR